MTSHPCNKYEQIMLSYLLSVKHSSLSYLLSVKSSLVTDGELGRYPAHISIISKIIKFWHRIANLDESCLLKQAHNVELSYLHRNSHQWLTLVYDTMKLCDMEDYFLDSSKSSALFIVNKITKILEDRFIKFWRRTV